MAVTGFDNHALGGIGRLNANISAVATSIVINSGIKPGDTFPDPASVGAYNATLVMADSFGNPQLPVFSGAYQNAERVRITAKAGDTFTATRSQESTTGIAFSSGDYMYAAIGPLDFTNIEYSVPINVKKFGALGDGVTDDSGACQAAINALPAAGGTIFFPPGTYKCQTGLTIPTGSVTLRGAGWSSIITGDAANLISANANADPQGGGRLIVKDLEFDCTKTSAAQTMLNVDVTAVAGDVNTSLYVEGCRFYLNGHIASIGIFIRGVDGAIISGSVFESDGAELAIGTYRGIGLEFAVSTSTLGVVVSNCDFNTLDKGVVATGNGGEGYTFVGCQFVGCQTENITIQSALLLQIDSCLFDSGHSNGLDIDSCLSVYISNTWISPNQNGFAGISITTTLSVSNRIRIVNCELVSAAGSPGNAIAIDCTGHASKGLSILGCSIRGWASGIVFAGAAMTMSEIIGNSFQGMTNGIAFSTFLQNSIVQGNTFDTDVTNPMTGTLDGNIVQGNIGHNNTQNALQALASASLTLTGGVLADVTGATLTLKVPGVYLICANFLFQEIGAGDLTFTFSGWIMVNSVLQTAIAVWVPVTASEWATVSCFAIVTVATVPVTAKLQAEKNGGTGSSKCDGVSSVTGISAVRLG